MEKKIGFLKAKTVMYIGLLLLFSGIMGLAFGDGTSNDDKFFEIGDLIFGSIIIVIAVFGPGQEALKEFDVKFWKVRSIVLATMVIMVAIILEFCFPNISQVVRFLILCVASMPLAVFKLQYNRRKKVERSAGR